MQTFFTIVLSALLASLAVLLLDPVDSGSSSSGFVAEEVSVASDQG